MAGVRNAKLTGGEIQRAWRTRQLDLTNRRLKALPPEVLHLTDLQRLDLDGNQLRSLPSEIGRLTGLLRLSLRHNQLTRVSREIGKLTDLESLDLEDNQLTALPPEITQLTALQTLGLRGNQLTALQPEITQLTALQHLDLRGNQLKALPPEITELTALQFLSLAGNQLTELPPEIGGLASLVHLDVRGNQLITLPQQLADLLAGKLAIRLDGNPLPNPIGELAERGTAALATYLRSLDDALPQYETKMLLVGEGNVGKTSLIAALLDAPFVEGRPTTHGIEIHPLTFRHATRDVDMTVRAWDFGGQEVYRIAHQFFFTRRALYLVVWKARQGREQDDVRGVAPPDQAPHSRRCASSGGGHPLRRAPPRARLPAPEAAVPQPLGRAA